MRNLLLLFVLGLTVFSCSEENGSENPPIPGNSNYYFKDGVIAEKVLDNYLKRAISQTEFLSSPGFYSDPYYMFTDDDERMLLNIGAKFIGRAIFCWGKEAYFNNPQWLNIAKQKANSIHAKDPDIILQAAIFEVASKEVELIKVPSWVFDAFDLPVENRNFIYDNMKFSDGSFNDIWGKGTTIPDITKIETQMLFYYMAVKYMEVGCEAIHIGQLVIIAKNDAKLNSSGQTQSDSYIASRKLVGKIRKAALKYARRGTVLLDAHIPPQATGMKQTVCGNISVNGNLLLDFGSFPIRMKNTAATTENPLPASLDLFTSTNNIVATDAIYKRTVGGTTPSGWICERSPYIVEFDNGGFEKNAPVFMDKISDYLIWGFDEISWFYQLSEQNRNECLKYATKWLADNDKYGSVQVPGSRWVNYEAQNTFSGRYRANTKSASCPGGMSQEETIKELWSN